MPDCSHCGTPLRPEAFYCLRCGRPRSQAPAGAAPQFSAFPAPGRRPGVLKWVGVGLAVCVLGGAVVGGVLLSQNKKDGGEHHTLGIDEESPAAPAPLPAAPNGPPPSASASPSGSPSASASASPSPSDSASASLSASASPSGDPVPAGYEKMTAPEGFALSVPAGWRRDDKGSGQIDYAGSTGPEHLRIGIVHDTKQAPYEHFQELEKAGAGQNGYRRLSMERNTFQGRPGALWEWTWTEKATGRTMHAYNQAYVDASGTEYAIMFAGRDEGDATRKPFDAALGSWQAGPRASG
ncbi:zinc ribbon domain-containing protein [Streptomyces klenkii]|uniref:Zinc ribbon domain-containing protein n=1 Tax=Streptomyces klenkii TaxID=1420899 RepID=A0A3B0BEA0_9ACTN|nr:zinc ribbon domain-containing protein [Streptomyces klenkii]